MNPKQITVILFFVLGVLYFSCLNRISLTDPDEVFYSLTAKEMLESNSFMTPVIFGQPQFEKPPLYYWCLMASFKVFGIHPFSARLVPAISGFLGILLTFFFCRRVFNEEIALTAATVLGVSALYLVLSKAVLTDIMLSVCMTAAFFAFYLWFLERRQCWLYGFACGTALAVLTKGPVAIIILLTACALFLIWMKEYKLLKEFVIHPWVLVFGLIAIPWYAAVIAKYGRVFIDEFFIHDNWHRILYAEHKRCDTWHFYPMVMAAGLFPCTFYLLMMGRRWKEYRKECLFLLIWVAVTFIIFQKAHSKLASYILPLMPAWVILLSISLSAFQKCRRSIILASIYGLLGIGLIVAPIFLVSNFPEYLWPGVCWGVRLLGVAFFIAAFFLWRGDVYKALMTKTIGMMLLLLAAGIGTPLSLDRMVSDRYIKDIIDQYGFQADTIVTNKMFARGVHFHAGNPVVVMDEKKQPFWSPHPIEILATGDDIHRFFDSKERVLCVVKKAYAEGLDQVFIHQRRNTVLFKDGAKIVILSEKI